MQKKFEPLFAALLELEQLNPSVMVGLQPGLTDAEIDTLSVDFPYPLSSELRTLYRWRNGYKKGMLWTHQLFSEGMFFPLDQALDYYRDTEQFAREESALEFRDGVPPEPNLLDPRTFSGIRYNFWYPNWFPLLIQGGSESCFVTLGKELEQTAIYKIHVVDDHPLMKFDSITSLIKTTIDGFRSGAYRIDTEGNVSVDTVKEASIINLHNPQRRQWYLRLANDSQTIEEVVTNLGNNDPKKRVGVAVALSNLLDPASVPGLQKLLTYPERSVRWSVVQLLGEMRDAGSLEALVPLLEDRDQSVQIRVIQSLWAIGDSRAIPVLEAKLSRTRDDKLRQTIVTGLKILREAKK